MPVPQAPAKLKLDPFAFPAETDSLFTLLIVVFLILIFYQAPTISNLYAIQGRADESAQASSHVITDDEIMKPYSFEQQKVKSLEGMYLSFNTVFYPILLTSLALILTAIIYYRYPKRIIKKGGLVLLGDGEHNSLKEKLESLARQLRLEDIPDFYIKNGLRGANAQTFGTRKTYRVRLDEGLVKIVPRKDPKMFEAVILHEFAHFYHHDVMKNYLAKSLTIAGIILLFIPLVFLLILTLGRNAFIFFQDANLNKFLWQSFFILTVVVQVIALAFFFFFLRLQLLKSRESYADYRASNWGARESLVRIVESKKAEQKGMWKILMRSHPVDSQRLKYLNEPEKFFALSKSLPIITGLLLALFQQGIITIVLPILMFLISSSTYISSSIMIYAVKNRDLELIDTVTALMGMFTATIFAVIGLTVLFIAYLIVKTLILQIVRQSVANFVTEEKKNIDYLGLLKVAILLGIGFVIGLAVTPLSVIYHIQSGFFNLSLLLLPVSIFLFWLVFIWVNILTRGFITTHLKTKTPRMKFTIVMLLASFLIGFPLLLQNFVLMVPFMGNLAISEMFVPAMWFIGTGVLIFFPLIIGGSRLMVFLREEIGSFKCPHCKQKLNKGQIGKQTCPECGFALLPWLYSRV
jgi:Zn-dependent protease with chaperone function